MPNSDLSMESQRSDAPRSGPAEPFKVLVVDDDPIVRRALCRALRTAGMLSVDAADGEQALSAMDGAAFDCVVTDIAMPAMDGLELFRRVRAKTPHAQIILITGRPTLHSALRGLDEGAFKYLHKPVDHGVLTEHVVRASRLARLAREEASNPQARSFAPAGVPADVRAAFFRGLSSVSLAYQPIVSATEPRLLGYEALLRCDPAAFRDPLAFISAGEAAGEVQLLGRFVRGAAAARLQELDALEQVFLNVHPLDLVDPDFSTWAAGLKNRTQRFVLELSERADMSGVPHSALRIAGLKKLGFRIAVDDVGAIEAGISDFSRFEPDFLKLDVSLVRGIHEDDAKRRVVSSIAGLCRGLRATVVAEGVETEAERQTLVDLGCDALQGFLFGRPAPDFQVPRWPHWHDR